MHSRIHVLIANALPVTRAGYRALLGGRGSIQVVGAVDLDQVSGALDELKPDVLVIGPYDAPDPAFLLRSVCGDERVRVVVIGAGDVPERALDAFAAGAAAYLPADIGAEELGHAVEEVSHGGHVIPAEIAYRALLAARPKPEDPAPLTLRELEVLRLVGQGATNAQIAGHLFLALGTVKIHIEHILAKLGAVSRTDAAMRAAEQGLLGHEGSADRPRP